MKTHMWSRGPAVGLNTTKDEIRLTKDCPSQVLLPSPIHRSSSTNLKTPTEFKRLASGALNLVKMELLSTKSHEAPV